MPAPPVRWFTSTMATDFSVSSAASGIWLGPWSPFLCSGAKRNVHSDMLPGSFFGPSNLVELLRHRAEHQAGDTAFAFLADGENESERVSYRELELRARSIGAHLQEM